MANTKLLFLIVLIALFQMNVSEVCYVSNCRTCSSFNANQCISCYSGYYLSGGYCYLLDVGYNFTWVIIASIVIFFSVIGAICRCCCYRAQSSSVVMVSGYQPPQPSSPTHIITTSSTTNNMAPIPYNNYSPNQNYNNNNYANFSFADRKMNASSSKGLIQINKEKSLENSRSYNNDNNLTNQVWVYNNILILLFT